MEPKGVPVSGSIGILYSFKDGKHHYEVDTVIDDTRGKTKFFMRKGDQISTINEMETQDLTPEAFAEMLSKGSPMLTVHHPEVNQDEAKDQFEKDDQKPKKRFYPVSKENTVLTIFPKMVTSPDLQLSTDEGVEDDLQMDDDWIQRERQQESGVLLVRMVGTTVSVLRGRGGTDCILEDVVLVSDSAEVTKLPDFEKGNEVKNKSIEDLMYGTFLSYDKKDLLPKLLPKLSDSENVTIYSYEEDDKETNHNGTDSDYIGTPVVLNFTGTTMFLKCSGTQTDVTLRVEECNKEDLKDICPKKSTYKELLSYLFYMNSKTSTERTFESARFKGWFLHAASKDTVDAKQTQSPKEQALSFLIRPFPG